MKIIQYKTTGATLEIGADGKPTRKSINAIVEIPFSEENLQQAKAAGLPGSVQTLNINDHENLHGAQCGSAQQNILLADRTTGEIYEVYVDAGKLMMEVL